MIAACARGGGVGGNGETEPGATSPPEAASGAGGSGHAGGAGFGSSSTGGSAPTEAVAFVSGTVLAPEGTIPISGALVYATQKEVSPIPQVVFCDRCVELPASAAYTFSAADGTFSLGIPATGDWTIVTQKGAFRRLQAVSVTQSMDQHLDDAATTLPAKRNPATGDEIPKMAVATVEVGTWDNISNSLAKLGLGTVDGFGDLKPGSENFDVYGPKSTHGEAATLLNDYQVLSQYHIVFFPCAVDWPDGYLTDPKVLANLRDFMRAGGRIYATDYSYDILKRAFEEPISWLHDTGSFGAAETSEYDAPATVIDQDMAAWLAAQGVSSFTLESNFTVVDAVQSYQAPDEDGKTITMNPKVWVNAAVPGEGDRPATISYQYGCGRALFSTYHTEPWGLDQAMPQELALLYTILEVGVCLGELPPPK